MNFSTTQVTNIATFASLMVLVAQHFNFALSNDQATTIIAGGVALFSVVLSYVHTHSKGLTTVVGTYRK